VLVPAVHAAADIGGDECERHQVTDGPAPHKAVQLVLQNPVF